VLGSVVVVILDSEVDSVLTLVVIVAVEDVRDAAVESVIVAVVVLTELVDADTGVIFVVSVGFIVDVTSVNIVVAKVGSKVVTSKVVGDLVEVDSVVVDAFDTIVDAAEVLVDVDDKVVTVKDEVVDGVVSAATVIAVCVLEVIDVFVNGLVATVDSAVVDVNKVGLVDDVCDFEVVTVEMVVDSSSIIGVVDSNVVVDASVDVDGNFV
jgi:hypothetical protein